MIAGNFRRSDANVFGYDLIQVLERDCGSAAHKR
jgi:hypothetical protein